MRISLARTLIGLLSIVMLAPIVCAEDNPIYKELLEKGVELTNGKTVKLAEPVMVDGLSEAEQQAILAKLTNKNRLIGFLNGGINDWYELQITAEPGAKKEDSIGRRVDLYWVAKGQLETVASEGFTKRLLNRGGEETPKQPTDDKKQASTEKKGEAEKKDAKKSEEAKKGDDSKKAATSKKDEGKAEFYTDEELKERKLTVVSSDTLKERYAHAFNNILGKVEVRGTGHGFQLRAKDSVIVACKLDPRFAEDPKYPNQWQAIKIVNGRSVLGDPEKYSGLGAYIKATRLLGPEDKVFVEYHLVFDEPYGWFNGGPNLVAHLDQLYKPDVRKFRRDLLDYEKNKAGTGK